MNPVTLIVLTLAGLVLFAVLAAYILSRFVPGPEDEHRPTVPHTWIRHNCRCVSVMDDLPDPNYTTQAQEFAAQVAKEWRDRE